MDNYATPYNQGQNQAEKSETAHTLVNIWS